MGITKTTSRTFYTTADDAILKRHVDKGVYDLASTVFARSRAFMPVATGYLVSSAKITRSGSDVILESVNYPSRKASSRYEDNGSNQDYYAYGKGARVFVPAGKNAGKSRWFHQAHENVGDTSGFWGIKQ